MALPHRRGYGSTDELSPPAADGFTETDLRAGGPWLPDFLCSRYTILPKSSPYTDLLWRDGGAISSQLEALCRAQNYRVGSAIFWGRRSVYEPDAETTTTTTTTTTLAVSLMGRREDDPPYACTRINLARMVWRDLCGRGLEGITVEVADVSVIRRPEIYPCFPTDEIYSVWTEVAMKIFDRIDRTGVFTIGCFRIGGDGWDRLESLPTVLIGVDRHSRRDWKDVRETVVSILDGRGLDSVVVTIRKDNAIARGVLSMDYDPGARTADFRPDPRPGTSLGSCSKHGVYSEGRLGGWVEVKNPHSEVWVPLALTCSRCCFPEQSTLYAADTEVIRGWKDRGVHQGDAHRDRLLQVDSPSDHGIEKGLESIADVIAQVKRRLDYFEAERQKEKDEDMSRRMERWLEESSKTLTDLQNEQSQIKNLRNSKSHRLGTVFASSGERQVPSTSNPKHLSLSIRDWALVQPTAPRRAGPNMVKHTIFPNEDQQLIHLLPEPPDVDEKLYTPAAQGVYGNLKTCHITTKIENGRAVVVPTFEHVVVRCKTRVQGEKRLDEPGSFVYESAGLIKGMVFGGSGSGDLGYFTGTKDLLDDIEHITGAEVRFLYVD